MEVTVQHGELDSDSTQRALPFGEALAAADGPAPVSGAASPTCCESCARPAEIDGLCETCYRAFASVLGGTSGPADKDISPAPAQSIAVVEVAEAAPAIESLISIVSFEPSEPLTAAPVDAPVDEGVSAQVEAELDDAAAAEIAPAAPAAAEATMPMSEPSPVVKRATAPARASSPISRRVRLVGAAAAVALIAGAVGVPLGKLWLAGQSPTPVSQEKVEHRRPDSKAKGTAPVTRTTKSTRSNGVATPAPKARASVATAARPRSGTAVVASRSAAAPRPVAALGAGSTPRAGSAQRQPSAPRTTSARPQPRPAHPVGQSYREPELVAAIGPRSELAVDSTLPAFETVEARPAAFEAATTPSGPFFEARQVDQTPTVASRVEPQVPENLQHTTQGEIVVVRVLVSQAGQPSFVRLLRRSKAGLALDDAVLAAVKRWTFTPALKRGQSVSCWFHIGVPVGTTD
jgi:protein TonB